MKSVRRAVARVADTFYVGKPLDRQDVYNLVWPGSAQPPPMIMSLETKPIHTNSRILEWNW